jgi:hypothetical protein
MDRGSTAPSIINQLELFATSNEQIFKVPPLDIEDRKLIHNWAEEHNFHSYSKGIQPNRYIIIEKSERRYTINDCDIDYFIKEYKLPIPINKSPYIEYFLDLYEKDYQSKTKYHNFVDSLKCIQLTGYNLKTYKKYLLDKIVNYFKSNASYKQFLLDDIKSSSIDLSNINIYDTNTTEYYISLDIRKANFTSLKYYYPEITSYDTWEEFMNYFTEVEFFINSKPFRQIIFGNLNCKKISLLWKKITYNMYELLKSTNLNIVGKISDDELIIKTFKDNIQSDIDILNKLLNDNNLDKFWKITPYYIKYIARTDTYQKFYGKFCYYTNQCEIKGCEKDFFAQLYKQYKGLNLCNNDFKTTVNNYIVTFDEPLNIVFNI